MNDRAGKKSAGWQALLPAVAVALAVSVLLPMRTTSLGAQTAASQPAAAQWQIDAGWKVAFDVASVKQNKSAPGSPVNSNIPLGPGDVYSPTGGLFSATNLPLATYGFFAYKISGNDLQSIVSQLPKWATTDRFDIQARAEGNPTKDQFRLMMQALLADRFKLAIHSETRQLPVFGLVLDKPGKLGPKLQIHPADSACSENSAGTASSRLGARLAYNSGRRISRGLRRSIRLARIWPHPRRRTRCEHTTPCNNVERNGNFGPPSFGSDRTQWKF